MLMLMLLLAAGTAAHGAEPLKPCRLRGVEHEALCGSVQRALDSARPDGPRIEVQFAVLPALARNKKRDPLLLFAGGPGQSAIELAPQAAALLARFSNRRDIVLVDQRGTGRSAPLICEADDPARPLAEQFDRRLQRDRLAACLAKLQQLPHGDMRLYTTAIAMADFDAVRAALGAEQVNLVGASYGTRAALEYQRQFPQRVRRAVLDGAAPADMALPASLSIDNQAALDALFEACAKEPACAAREPGLRERWRALLASMPRRVTLAHPASGRMESVELTRDVVTAMVRGPLYAPALAAALPAAIGDATRGRFEPLAALAMSLGGGSRRHLQLAEGMHFAVVCAEDVPRLNDAAATPGADFGSGFAELYRELCPLLPKAEVPAAFTRLPAASAPVLVLSGGLDPATPPRHGERIARALGAKARHVVVANAGHGVLAAAGCLRDVVFRFVDAASEDEALKLDTGCAAALPRPPMFAPPEPGRGPR